MSWKLQGCVKGTYYVVHYQETRITVENCFCREGVNVNTIKTNLRQVRLKIILPLSASSPSRKVAD